VIYDDITEMFGLTALKFDKFLSGILPLRHVVILSNFMKEIAHTDREPHFLRACY